VSYQFRDKVILVTGGTGGIGSALSHRFAIGGATCLVADIDTARAEMVAARLPGSQHAGIGCDMLDRAAAERLFDRISAAHGRLDVLVNNVGMTSAERFDVRSVESCAAEGWPVRTTGVWREPRTHR
jgi:NAD(P)-dependent dehydrogenase (short-subunit alcohol dehydrogenase family)